MIPAKRRLARSLVGSRSVFHGAGFTAIGAAYTIAHEAEFEEPFDFLRALCVNGGGSTYTIANVKFAASPIAGADGTSLTHVQGSFSNTGANSPPGAISTPPITQIVPAKTSGSGADVIPGYSWTDWAQVSSVERTDGAKRYMAQCRIALPNGATIISVSGANEAAVYDGVSNIPRFRSALGAGDMVTSISALPPVSNNGWFGVASFQALHRSAAVNIVEVGDSLSLSRGQGWTDQNTGHVSPGVLAYRDCNSPLDLPPIYYSNMAVSGQKQLPQGPWLSGILITILLMLL